MNFIPALMIMWEGFHSVRHQVSGLYFVTNIKKSNYLNLHCHNYDLPPQPLLGCSSPSWFILHNYNIKYDSNTDVFHFCRSVQLHLLFHFPCYTCLAKSKKKITTTSARYNNNFTCAVNCMNNCDYKFVTIFAHKGLLKFTCLSHIKISLLTSMHVFWWFYTYVCTVNFSNHYE